MIVYTGVFFLIAAVVVFQSLIFRSVCLKHKPLDELTHEGIQELMRFKKEGSAF